MMTKVKVEEPKSKESDAQLRKSLQSLFDDFHHKNKKFSSSFFEQKSAENQVNSENAAFGEAKICSKKKNKFSNEFNAESKKGGSEKFNETNVQNQKKNFSTERNFPRNANKFTRSHVIYDENSSIATDAPKAADNSMKSFKRHNRNNYSDEKDNYNKNFNSSNVMNKRRKFSSADDNEIKGSSKNFNKTSIKFEKNSPSAEQDFPRKENKSNKRESSISAGNKSFIKYSTHRIFDENDNSSSIAKPIDTPVKSIEKHNIKSVNHKSFKHGTHKIYGENADNSTMSKCKNSFVKFNKKHTKTDSDKDDSINKSFNNSSTSHKNKKRKFSLISNNDTNNTEKYGETNVKNSNQTKKNNSSVDFPKKKRRKMKHTDSNSFKDGSFMKPEIDAKDPHTISNKPFTSKTSPKKGNKFHTNELYGKSEDKKNPSPTDFPRNKKIVKKGISNVSFTEKFVPSKVHKIDESDKSDSDDGEIESNKFEKEKNCIIGNDSSLDFLSPSQSSNKSKSKHSSELQLKREKELQCTLFVGNLPLSSTKKDLKKLFSPFGPVTLIRFAKGEHNGSKNWKMPTVLNYAAESLPGFITFEQEQHASDALMLNGTVFKDHHITVNLAVSAGSKKLYDSKKSIFIGNLPFNVQDDNIWNAFSCCGKIQGVRLVRDKQTGIGKGFGYVQFHSVEARDNALKVNNLTIQGRTIRIKPVTSDKKQQKKSDTKVKIDPFRSKAIKLKKSNPNTNGRKSIKKLMKREKIIHKKKKIAAIMKKAMK